MPTNYVVDFLLYRKRQALWMTYMSVRGRSKNCPLLMADVHKTVSSFFQSKKSLLKTLLTVKLQITKKNERRREGENERAQERGVGEGGRASEQFLARV